MPRVGLSFLVLLPLAALFPSLASAQVAQRHQGPLGQATVADPRLRPGSTAEPFEAVQALLSTEVRTGWAAFSATAGGPWQAYVDARTGRIEVAEGAGIPWVPGAGNTLTPADLNAPLRNGQVDLGTLEKIARDFLPRVAPFLGVDPASLALSPGRSGLQGDGLWLVDFDVRQGGRTIEGARVVFRIAQGNLVQMGSVGLPSVGAPVPAQQVGRDQALAALAAHIGGFSSADTFLDGGSLHLLPAAAAEGFEPGRGRELIAAWQFVFRRKGTPGTWRGRVDATTGALLDFGDVNRYARVEGGVYTDSFITTPETSLPMPFADVSPAGTASSAGVYTYPGGTVTSTLDGPYVQIFDSCGPIAKTASVTGRINFGTSPGTDCATPGTGGGGNTHAARNQFYHLNRIKETGRAWLPGNSWLSAKLTANVNLNQTCNAYWDGTAVNFFRSASGCGNTGEIAGVSLHEFGHGLDENDGSAFSPDMGTGESYGDFTAALVTHRSCQGNGFFTGNCAGYGDPCTACSGVRDIDWAKHGSNTPHTVDNFTRDRCFSDFYAGPCGREGHCESYVISEALWDFAARDLPGPGSAAAWATVERLWYLTRSTAGSAFSCRPTNTPWTSDGCAAGSLWRTFRAADDDNGNLADGTPHSCQLFAAFDRHGLACPTDPGANVCFSACTPPAAPAVTLTPGDGQVQLAWTGSGPGAAYDVYKSELGCGSGFIRIAANLAGTAVTDTAVANGLTYSYQVIAHAAGNAACSAAPSTCGSAAPQSTCVPPPVPSGPVAQPFGNGIRLTWNPVPGAAELSVLRAAASGGPFTEITTLAGTATEFLDAGLPEGTRFWYVIRAAAGDCQSAPSAEVSATTALCSSSTLFAADFETGSGLAGWTVGSLDGGDTARWQGMQTCAAHSGSRIFRFGGMDCEDLYEDSESAYARPASPIPVPVPTSKTRLSFWHRFSFESGFDGGTVILSVDGGPFITVPGSAFLSGGYNEWSGTFTGDQDVFMNSVVDLDAACAVALGGSGRCAGHTVVFGFNVTSDSSVTYPGWYIDDVALTVCGGAACTGAPVAGAATVPGANQIQVSWTNGAPASSSFQVYRAAGSCAAAGGFEKIAGAVPGSPLLDVTVSGGSTYSYRVAGLDVTGLCESNLSACIQATATGPCALSPTFAGLASATEAGQATCALDLAWAPGTPRCAGGGVTYNVYRSTNPAFTPGPATLIAAGLTGTSFHDASALADRVAYFYLVRAANPASGQEEGNAVLRSATPTGLFVTPTTLNDTFEGAGGFDLTGWQHSSLAGATDWEWSNARSQSPTHSWYSASQSARLERALMSPSVVPTAGATLTFWHTYEFDECYDGATLEISANDGATWTVVPDAAFLEGGFTQTLYPGSALAGKRGWCLGTLGTMTRVRLDLSAWAGQAVRLRWHAAEDTVTAQPGWFVDSVTLAGVGAKTACAAAPLPALDFHTLPPCRILDTRNPIGAFGGPALQPGATRVLTLAGVCGVPATAKAVAVNVTVVQPAAGGFVTLAPTGLPLPATSTINMAPGVTRANNALLGLGTGAVQVKAVSTGAVQLLLDVTGYFEE
jgi:hypothetical protein